LTSCFTGLDYSLLQIKKLHRYEQVAIRRRQRAIEEWDSYQVNKQILKLA
jgi:hypothetical protein